MTYRIRHELHVQLLDQIVVALEQKVHGELLEKIRNVVIRWCVLYQTLHVDAARGVKRIGEGLDKLLVG